MKRSRSSLTFTLALLLALGGGLAGADDTEIYVGNVSVSQEGVRPNVLLILDTSSSMVTNKVAGTNKTRLDNMKDALHTILENSNNINVGLMRFSDPGGPILYPVTYIDQSLEAEGSASAVDNGNVSVYLHHGINDAEEYNENGNVTLTDNTLELIDNPTLGEGSGADTGEKSIRIASSSDDADERTFNHHVSTTDTDLRSGRILGLRFADVQIPPGATINGAVIQFVTSSARNGSFTFNIKAQDADDPASFTSNNYDISGRTWSGDINWAVGNNDFNQANQTAVSESITELVQSLVDRSGWHSGQAMAFRLEASSGWGGGDRRFYSFDGAATDANRPTLIINYTASGTGQGFTDTTQTVGVRFDEVAIPQGATINTAYIKFTAAAGSSETGDTLNIHAEESDNAAEFEATDHNLSDRVPATAGVSWSASSTPALGTWTTGEAYQTPELKDLVQAVVDRDGWCGNNAMAFLIQGTGTHIAQSYEGNASSAPQLYVDYTYDPASPPSTADPGCNNTIVQSQIASQNDDADQKLSNPYRNYVSVSRTYLPMDQDHYVGLRFSNLDIKQNAEILEAQLIFTASEADTDSTTLTIQGQSLGDPAEFSTTYSDLSTSNRTRTSASVTWSTDDWAKDAQYASPDLKSIIQEIVNRGDWNSGNHLVLLLTSDGSSTGRRGVAIGSNSYSNGAILKIKVKSNSGGKTVRTHLEELVDGLNGNGYTPTVDVLAEAARYYRGEAVHWGLTRGVPSPVVIDGGTVFENQKNNRVSHPDSYTGGTVTPSGCADGDPNANSDSCTDEHITGNAIYKSPVTDWCQKNYIVLLTDGQANHNSSDGSGGYNPWGWNYVDLPSWYPSDGPLIQQMMNSAPDPVSPAIGTDDSDCTLDNPDSSGENCGRELVKFLHDNDQLDDSTHGWFPTNQEKQTVNTYTIGFNLGDGDPAVEFLDDLAKLGGSGHYYQATTAGSLTSVFQTIVGEILSSTSSFSAPAVSVNAFNKLYHDNDVYFSMFLPKRTKGWPGNLKKYHICEGKLGDTCTFGEILDENDDPAISVTNHFKSDSQSYWSSTADGDVVQKGGAGEHIPSHTSRKIYTYTGDSAPNNSTLSTINEAYYNTIGQVGYVAADDPIRQKLNAVSLSDTDYQNLIHWMLGEDVQDEDGDGNTTEKRWAFADTLHSQPLVITYGQDTSDPNNPVPIKRIVTATNDGALHMINTYNGVEEWSFIPQAMLANQKTLRDNPEGDHIYGIDGYITKLVQDNNGDGIIDPGANDSVWIFFGMRRGGREYYALNVTPTSKVTSVSSSAGIVPKLKWRIQGGSGDFAYLGQTWSAPEPATVRYHDSDTDTNSLKSTVIFSGGYDDDQDTKFGASSYGNAVYVVDASTGARLWWAGTDGTTTTSTHLELSGMKYPIPATPAMIDSNNQGTIDRLYLADTGGRIWRIYLGAALGDGTAQGKVFATVSTDNPDDTVTVPAEADRRKFFYRPDVAKVYDGIFSSYPKYDIVTAITGDRANPLTTAVHDRVYTFRDYHISGALPSGWGPIKNSDLYDATSNNIQDSDGNYVTNEVNSLRTESGWYINLNENNGTWTGEKGLSRTLILNSKLFFTTYLPKGTGASESDPCGSPIEGGGRLYAVNLLNAAAVYPSWDGNAGDYTRNDRHYDVSLPGIPSQPVPIILPGGTTIIVGSGGGALDPSKTEIKIENESPRTFWYQDQTQ